MLLPLVLMQVGVPAPVEQTAPEPPAVAQPSEPPVAEQPPVEPPEDRKRARWFGRVSVGGGFFFSTDQTRMMAKENYTLRGRLWLGTDAAWMATRYIGLGVFGAAALSSSEPKQGGPTLTDEAYMVGAQLPLVLGNEHVWFATTPRAGICWGYLGFTDHINSMVALTYGMDFSLLIRKAHIGISTGLQSAPTVVPGRLGRHYDLGGYYVLLTGVFDG
jgi:hypothetical protein